MELSSQSQSVLPVALTDLSILGCSIQADRLVKDVSSAFKRNQNWPGVILLSGNRFVGMLSRNRFFEALGKPFGIELYSKHSILDFYNQIGISALIIDAHTSIQDAVKIALSREIDQAYDPVVVRFSDSEYGLLNMHTLLTGQCEVLENLYNQVQKLSTKDPLTNVSNRRGFFEAARNEMGRYPNIESNITALMIDIDNFKIVNDIYGHFVGDCVIKAIADECQKGLRQTDLLGRFGGEEFIALLPNTTVEAAYHIAERVRENISNLIIYIEGFQVSVTISVGVCHIADAKGSLDNLLTQADQAMYAAKWKGRNQVTVWNPLIAQRVRNEVQDTTESGPVHNGRGTRRQFNEARIYDETIEGWAHALELRDKETLGHAQRVTTMTIELAQRVGVSEVDLVDIRRGALLHDIGKIAVPDHILFKPGTLSEEEWDVMRKHPIYAYELLSPITFLRRSIDIPYCHHEHWDGSGYPRGLRGEEIPLSARIFTIIDVWDALRSDRPYRQAWDSEEIKKYLIQESGRLLDPAIVPVFLDILNEKAGANNRLAIRPGS